jgi:hypothetical protein
MILTPKRYDNNVWKWMMNPIKLSIGQSNKQNCTLKGADLCCTVIIFLRGTNAVIFTSKVPPGNRHNYYAPINVKPSTIWKSIQSNETHQTLSIYLFDQSLIKVFKTIFNWNPQLKPHIILTSQFVPRLGFFVLGVLRVVHLSPKFKKV